MQPPTHEESACHGPAKKISAISRVASLKWGHNEPEPYVVAASGTSGTSVWKMSSARSPRHSTVARSSCVALSTRAPRSESLPKLSSARSIRPAAEVNCEATAKSRADQGLREMIRHGQPITFPGLAQTADVSVDFLYRCTEIRRRVEQLRAQQQNHPPRPEAQIPDDAPSSVVRTLTAQLTTLKQRHRDEVQSLRQALEAAHSENLELRRRLGPRISERLQN